MTLPPESYDPKALQGIEDSIAAAKNILTQSKDSTSKQPNIGSVVLDAERLLLEQELKRELRQESIRYRDKLKYKYDDLIQEDINIIEKIDNLNKYF